MNKQETITIDKDEYIHLIKLREYVQTWCDSYIECPNCGYYHPDGYICLECRERERKQQE